MANSFHSTDKVLNESIMLLENELQLGATVHSDFSTEFSATGRSIDIRRPTQYQGQANDLDITSYSEDVNQGHVTVTLDQTHTVAVTIGALERTLDFNRFSEDVLKPAMVTMKDKIETHIAGLYPEFYMFSGTPGTIPSTYKDLGRVGALMTDGAVPSTGRVAHHGTDASLELADGLKALTPEAKAKTALEMSSIGKMAGFMNYENVHMPTHTVGNYGGSGAVNGAAQNVTYDSVKATYSQSLVTDGWSNSRTGLLKRGDIITIAGVNAVNPVSKQDTGRLQTFTVLADADSGASTGPATLTISPPIITTGAYQTVTAAPADDASITVKTGTANSSYKQSMLFNPKAIALTTRALDIPSGQGLKTATKAGNKVVISCSEFVDGKTLAQTFRFDMLYKATVMDRRLGARLTS